MRILGEGVEDPTLGSRLPAFADERGESTLAISNAADACSKEAGAEWKDLQAIGKRSIV
jgi:hypothetical protein